MKKSKIVSAVKYIAFLGFGLALLWYVTKKQDIGALLNEFKSANYWWIAMAMLAGAFSHLFRAARWNLIIKSMGYKTRLSTTFYAVMIGYFANMLVPRLGEVSRCGVLNKNDKIPFNVLFGTVIAERIFDAICLIFLSFLVIFFQFDFLRTFLDNFLFQPLSLKFTNNKTAVLLAILLLIVLIVAIYIFYKTMNKRLKDKPFYYKLKRILLGFAEGIKAIKNIEKKWTFLIQTFFIWILYFFMTYLCFFALTSTSHLGIADGFTLLVLGSIGIVAPVPGGIGAFHFIIITSLVELFNINSASATSFAYISHTSQWALITLLGFYAFAVLFFKNRKKKNENKT